jgi:hypothetical protein
MTLGQVWLDLRAMGFSRTCVLYWLWTGQATTALDWYRTAQARSRESFTFLTGPGGGRRALPHAFPRGTRESHGTPDPGQNLPQGTPPDCSL